MRIIFTILFSMAVLCLFADRDDLRFFGYGTSDGVSVGKVRKVFQDSRGFLWIATEDGLNRFDGYEFEVFRNIDNSKTTISSNKIWDIIEDNQNRLWIATANGLNSYNLINGEFKVYQKDSTNNSLSDSEIRSLLLCNDSLLYIGTHEGGLNLMNIKTQKIKQIKLPGNPEFIRRITCIDQKLYLGTHSQKFYIYNPKNGKAKQRSIKVTDETGDIKINTFYPVSKYKKWIGTENGIFEWSEKDGSFIDVTPKHLFQNNKDVYRIRDFLLDKDSILWIATNQGLLRYENEKWRRYTSKPDEEFTLRSNWLVDLFEDESGSIWISSKENGINVIHNKKQKFRHYGVKHDENSLSNNLVFSFAQYDKNEILIGTVGGGIDSFNPGTEKFYNYNTRHPKLNNQITSIFVNSYDDIWVGSWGNGLQRFNPETGKVKTYDSNPDDEQTLSNKTIICINKENDQTFWVGTFKGLNKFNTQTETFTRYTNIDGLESHTIFFILRTHKNTLWLGTRGGGLARLNTRTMKAQSFIHAPNDKTSIANNVVKYIHKDFNGYFWIATEMGISRFDPKKETFTNYNVSDGLPNNNIWAVLPDKNQNLWLSTNKGLAKISLDSLSNIKSIKGYGKNEGILSLEFSQGSYLRDESNEMLYFGGTEGFYAFNPDEIKPRTYEPPVRITSIKIMDQEFMGDTLPSSKQEIVIPWNRNFISFEFVGLDFAHQGNILYKYKMVGQSNKWTQPSQRRFASFPDLKDGKYTFKVRSTNSEGIWGQKSHAELSIHITVKPPWWRTNLAYILYVIIPIIGVIIFIRLRTQKLKREKRILEEIVEERTAELRKKNRDITSSIQYAQRIQEAIIFPSIKEFSEEFRSVFVLFKPKDIVSGDFFWYIKSGKTRIFTAADCTGHGVPGAFMSIIGNNLLNQIVTEEEITDPAQILTELDERIKKALHQKGRKTDTFDGMDIALCAIEEGSSELIYAGAYNPLYHIRDQELTKYKATRRSIGGSQVRAKKEFTNHKVNIEKGDTIYIFSDGYADQFGGSKNKKFTSKQLQDKLISVQHENMPNQQMHMDNIIEDWMADFEQIDDMILVGVRF